MEDSSPLKTVYSRRQKNSSDESESSSASSSKKSKMSVTPGHKTDKLTKSDYGKQFRFRQLPKKVPRDMKNESSSDVSASVDDSFQTCKTHLLVIQHQTNMPKKAKTFRNQKGLIPMRRAILHFSLKVRTVLVFPGD